MRGKSTDNPRRLNRPAVWAKYVGCGVTLDILSGQSRYLIAHDTLLEWVERNTNALNTRSWRHDGHYSWPKPSKEMRAFLAQYEVVDTSA